MTSSRVAPNNCSQRSFRSRISPLCASAIVRGTGLKWKAAENRSSLARNSRSAEIHSVTSTAAHRSAGSPCSSIRSTLSTTSKSSPSLARTRTCRPPAGPNALSDSARSENATTSDQIPRSSLLLPMTSSWVNPSRSSQAGFASRICPSTFPSERLVIAEHDGVRLERLLEALLALAECLLRSLALGYVLGEDLHADHIAIRVEHASVGG